MAQQASGCHLALQEPAPRVPSQGVPRFTHAPAYLPACLPVCLLACLPASLPASLTACLPACQPACLPTCLPPPSAARPGPRAPGGWQRPRKRTQATRCGPSPGVLQSRDSCRLHPAWPHAASASTLDSTARHLAAPHHTTLGCSLGSGWSELGAKGSSCLLGPPRWILCTSSPLGPSQPATSPFPPVCPTWCKPTPEPQAPQDNITSPSSLP